MQRNLFGLGGQPRKPLFARAIARLRGQTALLGLPADVDTTLMPPAQHNAKRTNQGIRRRGTAAVVALGFALTGTLIVGVGSTASAEYAGPGIEIYPGGVGGGYGTIWLGGLQNFPSSGIDDIIWCLQGRIASPADGDVPIGSSILNDPELAYAIGTEQIVETDLSRGALGYLVRMRQEVPGTVAGGDVEAARALYTQGTPDSVKDYAAELLTKAQANAGPYTTENATVTTETGRTGSVNNVGVKSAAGNFQAGLPFTLTITGPAVWDATGTNVLTGITGATGLSYNWTATGNGPVVSKMVTRGIVRTTLTKFDFAGNRQDVLTYGNRPSGFDPTEIQGNDVVWDAIFDFQPQATTERSERIVGENAPLIDAVTAFAAPGQDWLSTNSDVIVDATFKGTAYGPFNTPFVEGTTVPTDAPIAGTEYLTFSGPGTQNTSGNVQTTTPGYYTWVWEIVKDDQPDTFRDYIKGDWSDNFMIPIETSTVLAKIKHRSQAREYNVAPGGRAFDTIWLEGMPADHGTFAGLAEWATDLPTATVRVYGPLAEAPSTVNVPEGTPVFWEGEVPAQNGVYQIGYDDADPISPTEGGYYAFVLEFKGDDRVAPFTSPFNDLLERFYVPVTPDAKLPVQVVTQATTSVAKLEKFGDTALVMGTTEEGDYLVFEAIGPQDPNATAPDTTATPFFTSEQIPVTSAGYYHSGLTSVSDYGKVYWRETYYRNGEIYSQSEYGVESEITLVLPTPMAITTKSNGEVILGQPSFDTSYITGDVEPGTTLSFEVYKTNADNPVCEAPVWTTNYGEISVAGEYKSQEYVLPEDGHYEWVHVARNALGEEIDRGACGAPGEGADILLPTPSPTPSPSVPPSVPSAPAPSAPAPSAVKPPLLATTGANMAFIVAFAGTLVAAGGVTSIASRRRARSADALNEGA